MKSLNVAKIQLEREGYRNVTMAEAELYIRAGDKNFYKIIDEGFREAYWLCKHMEVFPGDPEFRPIYEAHRKTCVETTLQLYREKHEDYLELYILSDKDIVKSFLEDEPIFQG
jgi:hypothetical protein